MPPDTDFSPPGLADWIADAIEALELDDVTLVGSDTGGALCQIRLSQVHLSAAAEQAWPPFVLVSGLLLIGLIAHRDGLFEQTGRFLQSLAGPPVVLLAACLLLVAVVTAVLNLDTAVVFLTPCSFMRLVDAALRRRRSCTARSTWPTHPRSTSSGPISQTCSSWDHPPDLRRHVCRTHAS